MAICTLLVLYILNVDHYAALCWFYDNMLYTLIYNTHYYNLKVLSRWNCRLTIVKLVCRKINV